MQPHEPGSRQTHRTPGLARVLVVDDDTAGRRLCARILGRAGYHVLEAADGQEGLELALEQAPDLVLLDISMPVLDGFELAAALRAESQTRHVPFIFVTGERDPLVRARAYELGAHGFIAKPFDPGAISLLVERCVGHPVPTPRLAILDGAHAS